MAKVDLGSEGNVHAAMDGNKLILTVDLSKEMGTTGSGNVKIAQRRFTPDGQNGARAQKPATIQVQSWAK